MIIDVHTHIYPDRLAEAVLTGTAQEIDLHAKRGGTHGALCDQMRTSGVDVSVVLAVAPEPRLVKKTNEWLLSVRDQGVVFFGTIHPDLPDWEGELDRLREAGVKGIKFNALFQGIRPDDQRMFPIYEKMASDGTIAMFHAGASYKDRHDTREVVATPARIARVLDEFPRLTVIAAHYGGNHMLDEVEEYLIGRQLYLDTSYPPDFQGLSQERAARLIKAHGTERMLFGTDFPWETQEKGIEYLRQLPLGEREKEQILGENARQLLGLG